MKKEKRQQVVGWAASKKASGEHTKKALQIADTDVARVRYERGIKMAQQVAAHTPVQPDEVSASAAGVRDHEAAAYCCRAPGTRTPVKKKLLNHKPCIALSPLSPTLPTLPTLFRHDGYGHRD